MFRLFALLTLVFGLWILPASATGGVIGALNTNTPDEPVTEPTPGIPMPPQGSYLTLPIMIDCGNYKDVIGIVIRAGEQPFAAGKVLFKIPDGRAIEATLELWANPETRSFTSVLKITEEYACLVFPGKDFQGAPQQGLTL